jgi:hypothetical protein
MQPVTEARSLMWLAYEAIGGGSANVTVKELFRENPSSAQSSEPVTWGINPDDI